MFNFTYRKNTLVKQLLLMFDPLLNIYAKTRILQKILLLQI
jgi:hypothetical protein